MSFQQIFMIFTFLEPANLCDSIVPLTTGRVACILEIRSDLGWRNGLFCNLGKSMSFHQNFMIPTSIEPCNQCKSIEPLTTGRGSCVLEI